MQAAKRKQERKLTPVRPNAGVGAWYARELNRLVYAMSRSAGYWMKLEYKNSGLAEDAAPDRIAAELRVLSAKWEAKFKRVTLSLATRFVARVLKHSDAQLQSRLRDNSLTVRFKMTREMQNTLSATIQEQVGLIRSIPQEYFTAVQGLVMRSAQRGRDVGTLSEELRERYAITHRRANTIARDQNNKATASMTQARQLALGIEEGHWHHSHAGKQPRKSHVRANGKKFNLKKGMLIDGEYILPGQKINCRCTWSPIIPGFEE